MVSGYRLAIDYGTSYTSAAIVDGGRPEVLELTGAQSSRYLPSMVLVDQRGELHVGRRAVAKRGAVPAENVCVAPKRQVGPEGVTLGGRQLSATDLVAATISKVAEEALHRHNGILPDEVVMTYPAAWSASRCEFIRSAAAAAGLVAQASSVALVPEPVAAVRFYASASSGPDVVVGDAVAVYDLGGGTFDCAVVRRTETGWTLAGPPGGDQRLGGEDFDEALLEWVADRVCVDDVERWAMFEGDDSPRGRSDWVALLEHIRAAKEELSSEESTEIGLPPGALPLDSLLIHRSEFTFLIAGQVDRSINAFEQCLAAAQVEPGELAAIYLTGGSSRIPYIKGEIHRRLGREPVTYKDPKAITALGALTVEEVRSSPGGGSTTASAQPPPVGAGGGGHPTADPDPPVVPRGPVVAKADLPDADVLEVSLRTIAAFTDPQSNGDAYRKVAVEAGGGEFLLLGGTPRRAALVTVPALASQEPATGTTVFVDPLPMVEWLAGRTGRVSVAGTTNSMTLTQTEGREPLRAVFAADEMTTQPVYGNPPQEEPVALLELTPEGVENLAGAVSAGTASTVHVVCGPTVMVFDGVAPDGSYSFDRPTELVVPRAPLAAALQMYLGWQVAVVVQRSCMQLVTDAEDFLACSFWSAADPTGADRTAPSGADLAVVTLTPQAVLGGVGSLGVQFHLVIDGVESATNGWNPVTFELRPGTHDIECYNTSTGRTYSRAKATVHVVAGQRLNLTFQQGMTTFNKGKLILR